MKVRKIFAMTAVAVASLTVSTFAQANDKESDDAHFVAASEYVTKAVGQAAAEIKLNILRDVESTSNKTLGKAETLTFVVKVNNTSTDNKG